MAASSPIPSGVPSSTADGNRKDPRARVLNMTVRYKSATVDEFIENHSHDISRGGIFIKTRSPFPAGTLLKFEVRIAEDQKVMNGVGRVVWRREAERAEEGFPAGMGIKFIKIGEGAAELISQMVAAREGAESSFDAGIRKSSEPASEAAGSGESVAANVGIPSLEAPALQVESSPLSLVPGEAETRVSNLPKKRPDLSPEKRKVVLQGPALENPPSDRAEQKSAGESAAKQAPQRRSERPRATLAEETTSPGARGRKRNADRSSPSLYGLFAVLGLAGLGLVLFQGKAPREAAAPNAPPPPPALKAEPPPQPVAPAPPHAETSAAAAPEAVDLPATAEASGEAALAEPVEPPPSVAAPPPAAKPPVAAAPPPAAAAPARRVEARPPARAPVAAAPKPAPPSKPVAPAPAKPPAASSPAAPAGSPTAAAPPVAATPAPTPPAAAAPPTVPEKPTAPVAPAASSSAPAKPPAPAPSAPPAATPPAAAAPPAATPPAATPAPADDNPY